MTQVRRIVGIDCGRSSVKAVTDGKVISFPSRIGEWRERRLVTSHGNDIELEYGGERYFAGDLAERESDFVRSMMTDSKANEDTLLLTLIALGRAGVNGNVTVVTGVPVAQHTPSEKRRIKELLAGEHRFTLNNTVCNVNIERVEVAVEGGAAFWTEPRGGTVRILDAGAKTINYVTMRDKSYVDRDSGTLPFGCDTNKSNDVRQLTARIAGEVSRKWNEKDTVLLVGGKANEIFTHITRYFPNTHVMDNAKFANARGYYRLGASL
jgi:plasmid segregation protein ParM